MCNLRERLATRENGFLIRGNELQFERKLVHSLKSENKIETEKFRLLNELCNAVISPYLLFKRYFRRRGQWFECGTIRIHAGTERCSRGQGPDPCQGLLPRVRELGIAVPTGTQAFIGLQVVMVSNWLIGSYYILTYMYSLWWILLTRNSSFFLRLPYIIITSTFQIRYCYLCSFFFIRCRCKI